NRADLPFAIFAALTLSPVATGAGAGKHSCSLVLVRALVSSRREVGRQLRLGPGRSPPLLDAHGQRLNLRGGQRAAPVTGEGWHWSFLRGRDDSSLRDDA